MGNKNAIGDICQIFLTIILAIIHFFVNIVMKICVQKDDIGQEHVNEREMLMGISTTSNLHSTAVPDNIITAEEEYGDYIVVSFQQRGEPEQDDGYYLDVTSRANENLLLQLLRPHYMTTSVFWWWYNIFEMLAGASKRVAMDVYAKILQVLKVKGGAPSPGSRAAHEEM